MPRTIRLAQPHDAVGIAELSRKAIEHGLPWTWTPSRVAKAIANTRTNVVVAEICGAIVGFGVMEYHDDSAHLLLFAVDEADRRKGLGSELLVWLEKVAQAAGISKISLEARADNAAALSFYEKHGYATQVEVLGMYHGAEDGVCLTKRFPRAPINSTVGRHKPATPPST